MGLYPPDHYNTKVIEQRVQLAINAATQAYKKSKDAWRLCREIEKLPASESPSRNKMVSLSDSMLSDCLDNP